MKFLYKYTAVKVVRMNANKQTKTHGDKTSKDVWERQTLKVLSGGN